jgi:hypothetical protein
MSDDDKAQLEQHFSEHRAVFKEAGIGVKDLLEGLESARRIYGDMTVQEFLTAPQRGTSPEPRRGRGNRPAREKAGAGKDGTIKSRAAIEKETVTAHYDSFSEDFERLNVSREEFLAGWDAACRIDPSVTAHRFLNVAPRH